MYQKSLIIRTSFRLALMVLYALCILKMPYSFYQFVKIVSLISFCLLVFMEYRIKPYIGFVLSVIGLIIYNPIFRLHFVRQTWLEINVGSFVILGGWIIIELVTSDIPKEKPERGASDYFIFYFRKTIFFVFWFLAGGNAILMILEGIFHFGSYADAFKSSPPTAEEIFEASPRSSVSIDTVQYQDSIYILSKRLDTVYRVSTENQK